VVPPLAPVQSRAVAMRAFIAAESEVRALVREYVKLHMVVNEDFGVIPGTPKPTLLKPGAEKLVDLFNVEPDYDVASRVEDWDRGLFHYEIKVTLKERNSGIVRAVGLGSANSREGRYRWRNGERTCPECGKATIIKGKAEYGGGFVCFAKKGGCGAKFDDDAPAIVDQQVGKVENDDIYTLVNTILKMAKKRALVDGAIALARCSDIFTQDVEDLPMNDEPRRPQTQAQPARSQKSTASPRAPEKTNEPAIPYGKYKGKLPSDQSVPVRELTYLVERLETAIKDPEKARFRASNQALYGAICAELDRRSVGHAPDNSDTNKGWGLEGDEYPEPYDVKADEHDRPRTPESTAP
jgi:hypothetical protein